MMYCKHCGKEIDETSTYCQHCGKQIDVYVESDKPIKTENSTWGILGIIFGAMGSGIGLIFSIIGLCTYKTKANRVRSWVGLGLYIGLTVISMILSALVFYNVISIPVPYMLLSIFA